MKDLQISTVIDAPPQEVFAVITDFTNAPKRIKGIKKMDVLTSGAPRLGTRFRETRVMFGREATETMEIYEWKPGRSYKMFAVNCGCRYESEMICEPEGSGTRLSMLFSAKPLSLGGKIAAGLMGWMATSACRKAMQQDLADIKAFVESNRPAAV